MAKKETESAREKRIKDICAAINEGSFGGENKDAVTWLGSSDSFGVERFSTGCQELDLALGGGWPKGRFIEIFGGEMVGKSTMVLHALAEYQKKWPEDDIALCDVEYTFAENYAQAIGVNTKFLLVNQPESGKQALNVITELIQKGVKCIVVDSVAALTTGTDNDGDIGDQSMGEQARMVSPALRKLTQEAGKHGTTIFWTNQIREKIGIQWGDKTTTPGGRALKHYASVRVHMKSLGAVREGTGDEKVAVCMKVKAEVKKSKVSPPFRTAEFFITFGHGVDQIASVVDSALACGVLTKRGAWFSFDGQNIGQGRADLLDLLRKDANLTDQIKNKIVAAPVVRVPVITDNVEESDEDSVIPDTTKVEIADA